MIENSNYAPIAYGVFQIVTNVNARRGGPAQLNIVKFLSNRIDGSLAIFVATMSRIVNMTVEERRQLQQRAVGAAACAAAAAYGAPQIADHAAQQQQQEAFLDQTVEMAEAINAERRGEDMIAALDLSRPWMQQVSYDVSEASEQVQPVSVQAFVDVMANLSPRMDVTAAERQRRDHACMSEAIYYEARSEALEGQVAVGEVVMNRVSSGYYPDDVCSVVYQGARRVTGCQFSFTCDGSMHRRPRGEAWEQAKAVAAFVLMGEQGRSITGDATHYHTDYVAPYWRVGLVKTKAIGTHIFYRFPETGQEWAAARSRQLQARLSPPSKPDAPAVQQAALTTEELQARELARMEGKDV